MTTDTLTRQPSPREVQQAAAAAGAMFKSLSGLEMMPKATLKRIWQHFDRHVAMMTRAQATTTEQLALVQQAQAAMQAVVQLPARDLRTLYEADTMIQRCGYQADLAEAAKAIIAAHPLLGPLAAEIEAEEKAADECRQATETHLRTMRDAAAPGEILADLRAQGIALDVDESGNLTAPRGAQIGPADLDRIARFKHALVALIRAEAEAAAEAAKPVVIA